MEQVIFSLKNLTFVHRNIQCVKFFV